MNYIEINGQRYLLVSLPDGSTSDDRWDNRESKTARLYMDYATAMELFTDGTNWYLVQTGERETIIEKEVEVEKEITVFVDREVTKEVLNEESGEYETIVVKIPSTDNNGNIILDDDGNPIFIPATETVQETQIVTETEIQAEVVMEPYEEIYDNSEYCVAGPITDNRDGTVFVKMGKKLAVELKDEELAEANMALKIIVEGE